MNNAFGSFIVLLARPFLDDGSRLGPAGATHLHVTWM
jgi:hypothetical protein